MSDRYCNLFRCPATVVLASAFICQGLFAQAPDDSPAQPAPDDVTAKADSQGSQTEDVLSPAEWRRVDAAVDRALAWLAKQQRPDGSFPTVEYGQPAITSLGVLAFMAHGHLPGEGPYGEQLNRAIDYVLACQKESGLIARAAPGGREIPRNVNEDLAIASVYNHTISGLMLCEAYGSIDEGREKRLQLAIRLAMDASLTMHRWQKARSGDRGGWRYLQPQMFLDSDVLVTGWQLQFLRSARNAGFDVPSKTIDEAVAYVLTCFQPQTGTFSYVPYLARLKTRALAGAGVLALAHAGKHNTPAAKQTGRWILERDFGEYNGLDPTVDTSELLDRYHYSLFNCTQAMYQLGGKSWREFFPPVVETLLANQNADGSWDPEKIHDGPYGNAYTTALVLMTLGASNELLSIYQR